MDLGKTWQLNFGGKTLSVNIGKYCYMSNGSCMVSCGDTTIMVNVTMSKEARDGIDFLPLSVDFEEKMYSVGKIPGGFKRREGKATDKGVLVARLIDRPLRPLFPKHFYNDVSIVVTALSIDPEVPAEPLAMLGSSLALCISNIPYDMPIGSVKIGCIDDRFIINPSFDELEKSDMDLMVSGLSDKIVMLEAGAKQVSEQKILEAIKYAQDYIVELIDFQKRIIAEINPTKVQVNPVELEQSMREQVVSIAKPIIEKIYVEHDKLAREHLEDNLEAEVLANFERISYEEKKLIRELLESLKKERVREQIIKQSLRPDGRSPLDIRPIWCEIGILPRVHGSGIFTRGKTQVLTTLTLGTMREAQLLDSIDEEETNRYMHHYNMPPYSTAEAKPLRAPGRREIGHGALAERALEPVLPNEEEFPYAIRTVSEVLSSNGSTSQASICGSSLALMDGGVPIKAPVAGIAIGLMCDGDKEIFLTDIQGLEDFYGDMDFKVAGTTEGITAIQMDIKVKGLSIATIETAFKRAKEGRLFILNEMSKVINSPRKDMSRFAPKITNFKINPKKIRDVIGSGGKTINKIIAETGVKIDISDEGVVQISTTNESMAQKAMDLIKDIVVDVEVNKEYEGVVTRTMPFGAFVEVLKGREGLVHISKMCPFHVNKVEDIVKKGDKVRVVVLKIDEKNRVDLRLLQNISNPDAMKPKAVEPKPEEIKSEETKPEEIKSEEKVEIKTESNIETPKE